MATSHTTAAAVAYRAAGCRLGGAVDGEGLVPEGLIEEVNRLYQNDIGPMNGAKVVARSWIDPQYKARLLQDGTPDVAFAMVELGMATGTVETARDLEEGLSYLARNRSLGPSAHRSAAPSR